jgi:predicted O-methyltransferase YrrM
MDEYGLESEERILSVLGRMEVDAAAGSFWNVPRTTAEFLFALASMPEVKKVLEIGTSNGYSGIFLSSALSHKEGLLYTVESHRGRFEKAAENFVAANLKKYVEQIYGHAPEVFLEGGPLAGERDFDLAFIDATKNEYGGYLGEVLPRMRPGGLIVADNCVSHRGELDGFFEMVERLAVEGKAKNTLLKVDNGLMLVSKVPDSGGPVTRGW